MSVQKYSHSQLLTSVDDGAKVNAKVYACLLCRKRRVKCDRTSPCSNCAKAGAECEYHDPPPPRRRKRKELDIPVEVRLQRYEDALRRNGFDPDEVVDVSRLNTPLRNNSRVASPDSSIGGAPHEAVAASAIEAKPGTGKLVTKQGGYIYLSNHLWQSVSSEFRDIDDALLDSAGNAVDEIFQEQSEDQSQDNRLFIFGTDILENLADSHPSAVQVFRLWQTFLDNVNPVTKIIHVPTLQPEILIAASDLGSVSRELEALLFSIYCIALRSLDDDEVLSSFKDTKASLMRHYQKCAQKALLNAGFLKSSKITVLQALHFFLMSAMNFYNPYELWALNAVEIRMAQRIGLHRDGSLLSLTPFETEYRRRLWWQVAVMDATIAHKCGSSSLLMPFDTDAGHPLNLNDSDLYPTMKELPREIERPTEMMFCLVRYEFAQWLHRNSRSQRVSPESYWDAVSRTATSTQEKENIIHELEVSLEKKILRHCDSSNPLHLMTDLVARIIINTTRFTAHHPRRYLEQGNAPTLSDRQHLFSTCINVLENTTKLMKSKQISNFFWHIDLHFPFDILVHLFSELRCRTAADEAAAQAWNLIDAICTRQYGSQHRAKNPLHTAMAELALRAWSAHVTLSRSKSIAALPQPVIISTFQKLLQRRKPFASAPAHTDVDASTKSTETLGEELHATNFMDTQALSLSHRPSIPSQVEPKPNSQSFNHSTDTLMNIDFFDELFGAGAGESLEYNPLDWSKWDELMNQSQQQVG